MDHKHYFNYSPKKKLTPEMISEQRILTLRKTAIKNNVILSKIKEIEEYNNHNEKSYEIKVSELSLNDEYSNGLISKFYEEDSQDKQIQMALSMINPQITKSEIKQFGIKQIRNWIQTLLCKGNQSLNITESLITKDILDSIVLIIYQNPQHVRILYETTYILIYLTHLPKYSLLLVNHIKSLYQFLIVQKDQIVIKQVLWIFHHMMLEGETMKDTICSQCDIINYICNVIETHDSNVISLNAMCFWIFGKLLKTRECIYLIKEKCIKIIPIIARYIRTQLDKNVFTESLMALKRFLGLFEETIHNTALLNMIKTLELPRYLAPFLSLKDASSNNKNAIMSVFISLANLSKYFAEEIIDQEVICHLEDVIRTITLNEEIKKKLVNTNNKFLNKILKLIEIFSSEQMPNSIKKSLVRKTKICSELFVLKRLVQNSLYEKELMNIFNNFLNSESQMIITHMIVIGIPELLNDSLDLSSSTEILLLSMTGIETIIKYGIGIVKTHNFVLAFLELKDCGGKLEKLLSHSNEKVAAYANHLLKEYFNYNKVKNN